ncbi:MAG: hypothetical protein HDS56_08060 [Barnesiella sp.]|nr:hypothetical protein [Bacteroidales bacterium]MBD5251111.1 hypothetical protein [Barnesiella sp.]MBD5253604.1 hypothetical protein [Barnesiella sp.]
MNRNTVIFALMAMACVPAAMAQRDNRMHENGVVSVVNNDTVSADHVEKTLKTVAPESPKENGLPRFAIVGRDRGFYFGIGAQLLGEAMYDFGADAGSNTAFTPSAFTPATPGNGSGIGFAWQSSSFYLNFVALPGTENQVGLFVKAKFNGTNNALRLYHIYAKYRGLTVGYTKSLFVDAAAEPMTIDDQGPNGYPSVRLFTAYWTQNFNKRWSGAIGIDAPATSLTTSDYTSAVKARTPSIPLYVQYAWNDKSHIRLSGLLRPMQYRDLRHERNHGLFGWGVQVSGMGHVAGPVSVQLNAVYGRGIGSYIQDDEGVGLDAVATGSTGDMKLVKTLGLTGGVHCAITKKLSSNIVYSHVTNWLPDEAEVTSDKYKAGDYVAANLIYSINKFVSTGVEYLYGLRKADDGSHIHANRIQAQIAVTF